MSSEIRYRAGIIGCGLIAGGHASGYLATPGVALVAGADPSKVQQKRFLEHHPQAKMNMYDTVEEMLAKEQLDLVSVCTWPPLHADGVVAAAQAKAKGIVCEKPMANSLGEVDRMLEACNANGTKLVVSHQRRFNKRYVEAKQALKEGKIGQLVEIRGFCGGDLQTDGTHNVDLIRFFNDDTPIKWVMGQINRQLWGRFGRETRRYGHEVEFAAMGRLEFANGVRGLTEVGEIARLEYQYIILEGTTGQIEVYGDRYRGPKPSGWRIRTDGSGWQEYLISDDANAFAVEIQELLRWIEQGGDHLLSGQSARADTEVLMAIYESARRRGPVELPLTVSESPLQAMVDAGEL